MKTKGIEFNKELDKFEIKEDYKQLGLCEWMNDCYDGALPCKTCLCANKGYMSGDDGQTFTINEALDILNRRYEDKKSNA